LASSWTIGASPHPGLGQLGPIENFRHHSIEEIYGAASAWYKKANELAWRLERENQQLRKEVNELRQGQATQTSSIETPEMAIRIAPEYLKSVYDNRQRIWEENSLGLNKREQQYRNTLRKYESTLQQYAEIEGRLHEYYAELSAMRTLLNEYRSKAAENERKKEQYRLIYQMQQQVDELRRRVARGEDIGYIGPAPTRTQMQLPAGVNEDVPGVIEQINRINIRE
jgi:DNA repair exonuclease SbcCD ATPase subunit